MALLDPFSLLTSALQLSSPSIAPATTTPSSPPTSPPAASSSLPQPSSDTTTSSNSRPVPPSISPAQSFRSIRSSDLTVTITALPSKYTSIQPYPATAFTAADSPADPTTTPSFPPIPASAPTGSEHRFRADTVVEIVLCICAAAVCLALASWWYAKGRRRGPQTIDPFTVVGRYSLGTDYNESPTEVRRAGEAGTQTNAPRAVQVPATERCRGLRANAVASAKASLGPRPKPASASAPGGRLAGCGLTQVASGVVRTTDHPAFRHETDGGVRLAGGRLGEVLDDDGNEDEGPDWGGPLDGLTLPPPYSSHFS